MLRGSLNVKLKMAKLDFCVLQSQRGGVFQWSLECSKHFMSEEWHARVGSGSGLLSLLKGTKYNELFRIWICRELLPWPSLMRKYVWFFSSDCLGLKEKWRHLINCFPSLSSSLSAFFCAFRSCISCLRLRRRSSRSIRTTSALQKHNCKT